MWNQITVAEWLEILSLEDEDLTPTEYLLERIATLTGDSYDDIDEDEFEDLQKQFAWLNQTPKFPEYKGTFTHLHFGAFIDLERLITKQAPIKKLDEIVLTVEGFEVWENELQEVHQRPISECVPIMDKYVNYRNKLIDKYKGLFDVEEDEEEDEPSEQVETRWAWERMIYELCKGDITKAKEVIALPHLMVLNWLSMVKELKLNQQAPIAENHS